MKCGAILYLEAYDVFSDDGEPSVGGCGDIKVVDASFFCIEAAVPLVVAVSPCCVEAMMLS